MEFEDEECLDVKNEMLLVRTSIYTPQYHIDMIHLGKLLFFLFSKFIPFFLSFYIF